MFIGLRATDEGESGDIRWLVAPTPLDVPCVEGPVSKDQREDLQVFSFLTALARRSGGTHPLEVRRGDDPPDRVIIRAGERSGLELTELTLSQVRRDLAHVRQLGRDLELRLARGGKRFEHLIGRRVHLVTLPFSMTSKGVDDSVIESVCSSLEVDRGCVGDGVDLSGGLPAQWPNTCGFYGQFADTLVMSYRDGVPGKLSVVATCQGEVRLSEVQSVLTLRVSEKDIAGNDELLITCGLPDSRGYVCPADQFMFQFLKEYEGRVALNLRYIKRVWLHSWGTEQLIRLTKSD